MQGVKNKAMERQEDARAVEGGANRAERRSQDGGTSSLDAQGESGVRRFVADAAFDP